MEQYGQQARRPESAPREITTTGGAQRSATVRHVDCLHATNSIDSPLHLQEASSCDQVEKWFRDAAVTRCFRCGTDEEAAPESASPHRYGNSLQSAGAGAPVCMARTPSGERAITPPRSALIGQLGRILHATHAAGWCPVPAERRTPPQPTSGSGGSQRGLAVGAGVWCIIRAGPGAVRPPFRYRRGL